MKAPSPIPEHQPPAADTQTAILNALPAHVALLDASGVIQAVNESWKRFAASNTLHAHTPDEFFIGCNYLDICEAATGDCAEEARQVATGLREVLAGETESFTLEYPCHSPEEKRWFRLMITPLRDPGTGGAVVMHINITDQKQTEKALAESERRFRRTFEQAAVGMAHVSVDGRFLRVNDRLCSITGYSREELQAMTYMDLTLHEDRMDGFQARQAILAGKQEAYSTEKRYRRKDGEVVWINLATAIERSPEGEPMYFISAIEDITSRKLDQSRLRRLNRLHAVLSGISEMTVRAQNRKELYQKACEIVVQNGRLRAAAVIGIETETGMAKPLAAGGENINYLDGLTIRKDDGPLSQGPIGTAFRTGLHDVCNDIAVDPRMAPWVDRSLRHGFKASAAFPLKLKGETLAVLALFAGESGYFQDDEIRLMVSVADDLSFALDSLDDQQRHQQAMNDLRASEATLSIAQSIVHLGSWELDLKHHDEGGDYPLAWSDELYRIAGYEPGSVPVSRAFFFSLVHPEDREPVRQAVSEAIRTRKDYSVLHRLVRPDGEVRILHETAQIFFDEETGEPLRVIGTAHDITEQKAAEEELRKANALLNAVTEGSPDAIFVKDLEGRYLLFNEGAAQLTGHTVQEVLGKDDSFLFAPEDIEALRAIDQRVIEANQTLTSEEMLTAAGVRRSYLSTKGPYRDAAGQVIGVIGIARDITERRRTEEALRESEERFQLAVRGSAAAIWDWNLLTGDIYYSPAYLEMMGYSPNDFPPRVETFDRHLHPEDKPAVNNALVAHFSQERRRYNVEFRMRTKSGEYRWFRSTGQAVYDADGRAYRMVGSTFDITNRKQNEAKLTEQATLLDKAQDAILVRDLEHRILYWNHGAERMYGWTAEEAVGRSIQELLYRDPAAFVTATDTTIARGEWLGELQQVTKEGQTLIVEARWTLVRDDQGQPKSILAINTDITEKKRLEQQFLRAQRMESIGTLAGGIAHDLNNVLSPIMMSIELLRLGETSQQRLGILGAIEGSARRGAAMVSQVLTFARGVEGQQLDVQTGHLIREVEKIANETFFKTIRIRSDIPVDLWLVRGDATQLHQVLLNLCVNARDAMPHGGTLRLLARNELLDSSSRSLDLDFQPGPYVLIQVEDTGTGMPPEVIERIFEPFFTTKEVGQGTGLGLSTTQAIVKSHGGFVRVYSEVGKGTKFCVYLPAKPDAKLAEEALAAAQLPRGRGELILVVDDESSVREITRETLESFGYQVVLASDGAEATAIYATRQKEISAVLTDMMMPVMDGPATIPVLLRMNPDLRIIAASGLNTNGIAARMLSSGVRHFLSKPYSAEILLRTLRKTLDEPLDRGHPRKN